jgi:hypothetical protein
MNLGDRRSPSVDRRGIDYFSASYQVLSGHFNESQLNFGDNRRRLRTIPYNRYAPRTQPDLWTNSTELTWGEGISPDGMLEPRVSACAGG